MHRARHLAEQGKRVLLTSFVTTLCKNIEHNVQILCTDSQRKLITVGTVHSQALRFAREVDSQLAPADEERIAKLIERLSGFRWGSVRQGISVDRVDGRCGEPGNSVLG